MSPWSSSPAAIAVESRLLRALAVLRVIVLVNALALSIYHAGTFERRGLGTVCLAVMVAWTAVAI